MKDCTLAVDTKKSDKYLQCSACNKFFLHGKRGRRPSACEEYRNKKQEYPNTQKVNNNPKGIQIPVLEAFDSLDEVEPGMLVYTMPSIIDGELARMRFSRKYKVLEVSEEDVTIIRAANLGYKNYPIKTTISSIYKKTGNQTIEIERELHE